VKEIYKQLLESETLSEGTTKTRTDRQEKIHLCDALKQAIEWRLVSTNGMACFLPCFHPATLYSDDDIYFHVINFCPFCGVQMRESRLFSKESIDV